jgi:DNA invertase Pin-like site-specific DNA recombinase
MAAVCQNNPTSKQMDVIQEYARRNNMEIIKVYSDEGKSGLNIKGRDALLQMLADAQSGWAEFFHILAYDVSRWGRFQDVDEGAYYETICNHAGITVHYCAEQFHHDGSIALSIIKTIKRSIAVESNGDLLANVLPEDDVLDWMI